MTFDKLFDQYMKSPGFRKLSVKSKQSYMYCGRTLAKHFGLTDIQGIKRSDLLRFQSEFQDKPALANMALRISSVVFSYAVDMDLMQFNPASRIKKMKIGSHVRWTQEEIGKVIAMGDRRVSTAVALAWYTGQREGDILAMRWQDYDGSYITLTQEKTGLEMKIKVHPDLAIYLNAIKGPAWHYIVSGDKPVKSSAFRNMLKRRTSKLSIDKVFHGIRKGVASALAENGRPISEIAAMMGHKSMRMAAYYAEQASSTVLTTSAVDNLPSL